MKEYISELKLAVERQVAYRPWTVVAGSLILGYFIGRIF